jgi:hypothetical protein
LGPDEIIFSLLKKYTLKRRNWVVPMYDFLSFIKVYLDRDETGRFDLFQTNTQDVVQAILITLNKSGSCQLYFRGDQIDTITFVDYFLILIRQGYNQLEKNGEEPFPSEAASGLMIPSSLVRVVDVKNDFIDFLKTSMGDREIIRFLFPGDLSNMIITGQLVKNRLLFFCLQKIQDFLNYKSNAAYLLRKIFPLLRQSEQYISYHFDIIRRMPSELLEEITSPTEVTFAFWTQLCNGVIKELMDKTERLPRETAHAQAAWILGNYLIYFRELVRRREETKAALRSLPDRFKKEPLVFSLGDVLNFKEGDVLLLGEKYTRKELTRFLSQMLVLKQGDYLPELLRFKTPDRHEYLIHRDMLGVLFFRLLNKARDKWRRHYLTEWEYQLNHYIKNPAMGDDKSFREDLTKRFQAGEPLLSQLLKFDLLFLMLQQNPLGKLARELEKCLNLNNKCLLPLETILDLSRSALLGDARKNVPFWRTLPLIGPLISFILKRRGLRSKAQSSAPPKPKAPRPVAFKSPSSGPPPSSRPPSSRSRRDEAVKQAAQLKAQWFGPGTDMADKLDELAEKWNFLFGQAKRDLREDVNALIRDYVRSLKKTFLSSSWDRSRIQTLAANLLQNDAFRGIPGKEPLKKYIEGYMLFILQEVLLE